MLRIGEVAKQFDISNRTLRYWEEMGVLKSTRTENGYRYYDGENTERINQIVFLRKLRVPIADIEQIFLVDDVSVAIDTLSKHYESLKRDVAVSNSLIAMVEILIRHVSECKKLEQLFSYLETQYSIIEPMHKNSPQINLSERIIHMSAERLDNVRIVRLPVMTVASYRAKSASPEDDCSKVMIPFVTSNNLHKSNGFRFFGFHPLDSKSENNRSYNYEQWVTIPPYFDAPEPFVKKQFDGGLFASVVTQMNEYGERWQALKNWCENSERYTDDVKEHSRQWFEEFIDFEIFYLDNDSKKPFGENQLDLLLPIKLK